MHSLYTRIVLSCLATLLFSFVAYLVISGTVGVDECNEKFGHVFQLQLSDAVRSWSEATPQPTRDRRWTWRHVTSKSRVIRRAVPQSIATRPSLCVVDLV